jgi:hypothetical protein
MALHNNSRAALVERIARLYLRDWKEGTASGGSTTTFIDTKRWEKDDYFNTTTPVSRLRVVTTTDSAAPQGEEMDISDWVLSTGTGTVRVALTAAIGSGDTYAILHKWYWDEITEAINAAIDKVVGKVFKEKITETTVLQRDKYEYDIPTGFTHLYRVTMQDDDGDFPYEIPFPDWRIVRGAATPQLHLTRYPTTGMGDGHYYHGKWANDKIDPPQTVIEDCDAVWTELIDTDVTESADEDDKKYGTASLKLVVAAGASAGDILATQAITSLDLSKKTYVGLWIKSSVTLAAGDLQLLLDDTAQCASPLETLDIPAVSTANQWTFVSMALANPTLDTDIISVGIKMVTDKTATFRFDDIAAPRVLRLEGFQKHAGVGADTSTSNLDPSFICPYAAYILHSSRIRRADNDPDEHAIQARINLEMAERVERQITTQFPANIRRVEL